MEPIQLDKARMMRIAEHLPQSGDLSLITLKGHLLAEEMLDAILLAHCRRPEAIDNIEIGFYLKTQLVKALDGNAEGDFMWELVDSLNALRNQLAHKLESPKAQAKLNHFLGTAQKYTGQLQATPDDIPLRLRLCIAFLLGCLNFLEIKARGIRGSAVDV